jgi:glycine hydroxymethyltransferase
MDLPPSDSTERTIGYGGRSKDPSGSRHPDQATALWNLLLEKGEPFGLQPTGLACRDSTRTEAGLPLYGHELVSPFGINPIEAGFSGYVKLHKPFFIGRRALMEKGYDSLLCRTVLKHEYHIVIRNLCV